MHEWIAAKYHGLILHLIDYIIVDGNLRRLTEGGGLTSAWKAKLIPLGQKFAPLVHLFHKASILRVKLLSKILCHHPLPLVRNPRLGITFHGCHLNYQPTLATMQRTSLAVVQEAFVPWGRKLSTLKLSSKVVLQYLAELFVRNRFSYPFVL